MGVVYLLLYVAAALWVTLGSWHWLGDLATGETWQLPWLGLAVAGVLVSGAAVLHALALRRRGQGGVLQGAATGLGASLWTGLLMLIVPPLAAWLQFEWFLEPVHMLPLWTVAGGMLVAYGLASHLLRNRLLAQPLSMVAVALVGCPLGLLAVALPAAHFQHHLSPVVFHVLLPGIEPASRQVLMSPSEPFREAGLSMALGEQTQALLQALGEVETVDVLAEQAAGRLRREPDGSWVGLAPDGTAVAVGTAADLAQAMSEAQAADARAAELAGAEAEAGWQQALRARRDGGRLLGLQRP